MSIVLLIPVVTIALILFFVVGIKFKSEEEGEELLKNIYIYLVLFATLMMSIGGSIGVFMSLADIVSPATYHQSFEEYKQWQIHDKNDNDSAVKSDEELRTAYEAMIEREQEQSKQRALNTLIKSFGWIVIPLPVFLYFQRRLPKRA